MNQLSRLAETFLAHTKVRSVPSTDVAALDNLLTCALETSRAKWPTVDLHDKLFVKHLAERLPAASPDTAIEPLLEQLSLAELYLACACLHGISSAIALFDRHYIATLPRLLRGLKQPYAVIDDACQLAREKILVRTPERAPKIAEYTGQGSLQGWVRVTTARIAIRLQSSEEPKPPHGFISVTPEPMAINKFLQPHFRQAVREAFSALSAEERHLLLLYFFHQLSTYELSALFRVNQATISRWLKSTRQKVYEETRRRLQARLNLSTRDFESFLAVLDSQLELSISRLLRESTGVPQKSKGG